MSDFKKLGSRFYYIHVPKERKVNSVVLVFHGGGSDPQAVEWESRFNEVADKEGFIVVYPGGTNGRWFIKYNYLYWNDGRVCTIDPAVNKSDDVGYITTLINNLKYSYSFDTVYAVGYSNGAQFCCRLAQELTYKIKSFACVCSRRSPASILPAPSSKISALFIGGKMDSVVPFEGGAQNVEGFEGEAEPFNGVVSNWALFNGCSKSITSPVGQYTTVTEYYNEDRIIVASHVSTNGGHTWPGGNSENRLLGPVNRDYFAAQTIWDFFKRT